jgi:hypothetical protein
MQSIQRVASLWVSSPLKHRKGLASAGYLFTAAVIVGLGGIWSPNLNHDRGPDGDRGDNQPSALLVKSYLLNAPLINRKAFPIGYRGAQVLRPASR